MMANYLSLKNGTDVRGTATEGGEPVTLTEEAARNIATAFFLWLKKRTGKAFPAVAVGHDTRLSSPSLCRAVTEGIAAWGGRVLLTGLSSTPSMFMLLQDGFGADGSVMITASHLPYRKNGLKFFVKEGGLEEEELEEVLTAASALPPPAAVRGEVTAKPYLATYAAQLVGTVRRATGKERPLAGKKIIVDAGGGVGGFYAGLVLEPLGADTSGSQFLQPDGLFSHHIPNPENAEAMKSLTDAVTRCGADLGVIFDTDVDRAGAVAEDGREINRNRLIALISAILLEEEPGAAIVTDSVTSDGLTAFITSHGGTHRRFKRGYKNVINECKRLNAAGVSSPLAIETSGHAAFRENYYLDDGAYLVTRLLVALAKAGEEGRSLTSLIASLPEPAEAAEVRLGFEKGCDFKTLGMGVIEDLKGYASDMPHLSLAPDSYEGARVNFAKGCGDGWALVRMSLHEPILPVNAESDSAGGVALILRELYAFLRRYPFLELASLEEAIRMQGGPCA